MTARIALFDLGNVILDWEPERLYRRRFGDAGQAAQFCRDICTRAWHATHDRGRSMADTIPELQARHPEHAAHIAAWRDQWLDMFHGYVSGMAELVARLEAARVPLYALSNLPAEKANETREAFRLLHVFRDTIVSGVEGVTKPDARIYRIALERMGDPDPEDVIFVDDLAENVRAAQALGMRGHVFSSARNLEDALIQIGLLGSPPV